MTPLNNKKNNAKADDAKPQPKKRRRFMSNLVLLVLLAAGAWWGWSTLKPLVFDLFVNLTAKPTDDAMPTIETLERRLVVLERRLKTIVAERRAVVPIESHELWWIAEAERYLVEASERLRTPADIRASLAAMKTARQTLEGTAATVADAAKAALDREIQLLSEYKNTAAARAIAIIDGLLEQFESGAPVARSDGSGVLPPSPRAAPADGGDKEESNESPGLWGWFSGALGARLKSLIVVEREDGGEAQWVMQNVTARSLTLARTAVLGGDVISYRYAITNAMRALRQNGMSEDPLYERLQTLHELDVAGAPPSIGEALNEIRALAVELTP